jgi:hypothetical protein
MSALGQKRTLEQVRVMSALPPKADINPRHQEIRFVPKGEIEQLGEDTILGQRNCALTASYNEPVVTNLTLR